MRVPLGCLLPEGSRLNVKSWNTFVVCQGYRLVCFVVLFYRRRQSSLSSLMLPHVRTCVNSVLLACLLLLLVWRGVLTLFFFTFSEGGELLSMVPPTIEALMDIMEGSKDLTELLDNDVVQDVVDQTRGLVEQVIKKVCSVFVLAFFFFVTSVVPGAGLGCLFYDSVALSRWRDCYFIRRTYRIVFMSCRGTVIS